MEVPFFKFESSDAEIANVKAVLDSGWLTTGKYTAEFERRFAERCECEFALAVNSCTAAMHLVLEALGVGEGDRVIVPSLTFTATAEVVRYLGADPLIVDVEAETGMLSAEQLKASIARDKKIKACMVVHYAGQSANLVGESGILDICTANGIVLLQDAAHAFPAAGQYGPVGSIGDATCFSFYANKTITTGEGGMIVTNDQAIAARAKVMRLHGIDRDVWDRFTSKGAPWEYDVIAPGFKYNMPDINAAIGLAQLDRADAFRVGRQAVALRYIENLHTLEQISLLQARVKAEQHAWHLFPIILGRDASVSRNELIERLKNDGISTSVHYRPLHRMTYYANRYDLQPEMFPNTEWFWQGCVSLPIYPSMTADQVDYVCDRLQAHLS